MKNAALLLSLPLALAATATHAASGCDPMTSRTVTPNVAFDTQIKPILDARCTFCHTGSNPAGGFDLSGDNISTLEAFALRVVPLKPRASDVFIQVNCDNPDRSFRMPLAQQSLTLAQQALIYDWIAQGARGTVDEVQISDIIFVDALESRHFD